LYVAVSDVPAWALARANTMAELRGWRYEILTRKYIISQTNAYLFSPFIGLQSRYNLLNRSLEYDLQPVCAELDVCIINLVHV
jgi:aryl-alcohol dehydrogenase-like predicted oxidoreductase